MISNLIKKVKTTVSNDTVVFAFSGGPDSVFLGEILYQSLSREKILVAHFNHKLRNSSDNEEVFCKHWAKEKNLNFFTEKWLEPIESEEKARDARYVFLYNLLEKYNAKYIVLGNHKDDKVETCFFNFLRGGGVKGLSGFQELCKNTKKFRPLVEVEKRFILEFLNKNKISYCVDQSNFESSYARNFIRNDVFPILIKKFPNFKNKIINQSYIFKNIDFFINEEVNDFLLNKCVFNELIKEYKVKKNSFLSLEEAIQSEIIKKLFLNLSFENVNHILGFIKTAKNGKKTIFKKRKILVFSDYFFIREA